jgi:cell wall-associated NlpC family hydrolase
MRIRQASDRMKLKYVNTTLKKERNAAPDMVQEVSPSEPGTASGNLPGAVPVTGEMHIEGISDVAEIRTEGWIPENEETELSVKSRAKETGQSVSEARKSVQVRKKEAMTSSEYADKFFRDPDAYLSEKEQREYRSMTPSQRKEVMTNSYRQYARDARNEEMKTAKQQFSDTGKAAADTAKEGIKAAEDSTVGSVVDSASPAGSIIRQGLKSAAEAGKEGIRQGREMSKEVGRLSEKNEAFDTAIEGEQMKQAQGIGKVAGAAGMALKTGADAAIGVGRAALAAATEGISLLAELIIKVILVAVIAVLLAMAGYETLTAIYSAYAVQEAADEPVSSATGEAIAAYAKQFIGVPYVWGGEDLNVAVDCSGFVRAVMAHFGIDCHGADAQGFGSGAVGTRVASIEDAVPGDIIFWPERHVGIYIGNGEAIQSSGGQANYDLAHAGPGVSIRSATYRTIGSIWRVVTDTTNTDTSLDGLNVTDLGQWRLTAYCNCPICCGSWSGGPTASGVMPTAGRTIAIAASTMSRLGLKFGDRIYINGHIYTLEDHGGSEMARSNNGLCIDIYVGKHSDCYNAAYNGMAEVYLVH